MKKEYQGRNLNFATRKEDQKFICKSPGCENEATVAAVVRDVDDVPVHACKECYVEYITYKMFTNIHEMEEETMDIVEKQLDEMDSK